MTGATSGIGLAAAVELARRGADLTLVARNPTRAAEAVRQINAVSTGRTADVMLADLASQSSVRQLAGELLASYPIIQVLVNNAGAVYSTRQMTEDGIELTWAVNHLAPFLLVTLVLDRLKARSPARIVTTSSGAHERAVIPFDDLNAERSWGGAGFTRYGETKLANILFTAELARRLEGTGVTANSFHPGFVASGFNRNNGALMRVGMVLTRPFARSAVKGAETLVWLIDSEEAGKTSGGYFFDQRQVAPSAAAQDGQAAQRLWQVSEEQTRASAPGRE
ncbi:MAG TPA: SDR family oxidoreductase [Candidatus Dormibacteraeota bacterium]|nr:SDR family oxidoreductase [Candidatus Dormibacteraeota bacterium]